MLLRDAQPIAEAEAGPSRGPASLKSPGMLLFLLFCKWRSPLLISESEAPFEGSYFALVREQASDVTERRIAEAVEQAWRLKKGMHEACSDSASKLTELL